MGGGGRGGREGVSGRPSRLKIRPRGSLRLKHYSDNSSKARQLSISTLWSRITTVMSLEFPIACLFAFCGAVLCSSVAAVVLLYSTAITASGVLPSQKRTKKRSKVIRTETVLQFSRRIQNLCLFCIVCVCVCVFCIACV